jgi:hypothetical protein
MKESDLKSLIRESNLKPIRICMDDGRAFTIHHPDFAFVANETLVLASGPGHDLGGLSFVLLYFEHISRVEMLKKKTKAAA